MYPTQNFPISIFFANSLLIHEVGMAGLQNGNFINLINTADINTLQAYMVQVYELAQQASTDQEYPTFRSLLNQARRIEERIVGKIE